MGRYNSAQQAVKEISKAMTQSMNPDEFNPDLGDLRYHVEKSIYIFSTAKRDFEISQPLFPGLKLKGCANGERYVLAAVIPDPVPQSSPDLERGGRRVDYHDGWTCAIGLLNPESSSRDPFIGSEGPTISIGMNYISQGLFPSMTNPPLEEHLRKAEAFRDRRYKWLTDGAFKAGAKSSKALSDYLTEHEDAHDAMDALGLTADWHQKRQVTRLCPNCGDSIPSSVAFHKSSTGILCVLDPERAFKAGAIDRARMEDLLTTPA
jgi:hypothetical protein